MDIKNLTDEQKKRLRAMGVELATLIVYGARQQKQFLENPWYTYSLEFEKTERQKAYCRRNLAKQRREHLAENLGR